MQLWSPWATRPGCCATLAADDLTITMISHNPDHAFVVDTTAALLHHETLQVGVPVEVITAENLAAAYGTEIQILHATATHGAAVTACVPLL
jgi:iron complex transport system ATP-binding protein